LYHFLHYIYILIFFIITIVNYIIGNRNIIYPGFIYSFLWTIVFSAYEFAPIEFNSISSKTCLILIAGDIAFSVGCYLSKISRFKVGIDKHSSQFDDIGKYILVGYSLLVFPFFCREVMAASGGGLSSFMELRKSINDAALSGTSVTSSIITGSAIRISIATTFIVFIGHVKGKYLLYVSIILSLAYCILNTSRTNLFSFIVGLVVIYILKRNDIIHFKKAILSLGIPSIIVIVFMMYVMLLTHYTENGNPWIIATGYFFVYLVGGIPAFDIIVNEKFMDAPHHTFQFFTQISNSVLGTHFKLPPTLDSYVYIPFPTNVYTSYKYFFQDFGIYGMLLTVAIIGFLYGLVFNLTKIKNKYGIYLYALAVYPLLMTFFDDIFCNFRGHIRDLFLVLLCYMVIPEILKFVIKPKQQQASRDPLGNH